MSGLDRIRAREEGVERSHCVTGVHVPTLLSWVAEFAETRMESRHKAFRWLDLGTGNGGVLNAAMEPLSRRALSVEAVDLEEPRARNASVRHIRQDLVDFIDGAIRDGKRYDLVSMTDVIEHFPRPESERVIARVKELGSVVFVSTPRGFLRQDPTTHPEFAEVPGQWHRCGYEIESLRNLGFDTFVLPGYDIDPPGHAGAVDKLIGVYGLRDRWPEFRGFVKARRLRMLAEPRNAVMLARWKWEAYRARVRAGRQST